ncbi:MAG TPA: DNA polymerase Y family protein [Opitutaceae bacterium]|nr:DNA polymerase Y family protein [Opitutaceae bacterium]
MNYAVLWVPDFALHALRRSDPALAGRPVALIAGEGRRAVVTEAAPEAAGVAPGLAATLAMARCPGIVLRPRDPDAEVEANRLLLAAAFTLAPRVEFTGSGCCTVDLQGADEARTEAEMRLRVAELARAGLPVRIGAAATPLLAAYAARGAEPVRLVADAGAFLAPLPLAVAEPTPAHAEILRGWGIRTLGQLTALPKAEVGRRLGTDGAALWERAAGEATRVLRLVAPPTTFIAEWDYDPPVESVEPLLFRLRRFAERLALELRAAGAVADQLTLRLFLEDETEHAREFRLPEPGADVDLWLRVLLAHLETVRTAARVTGVRLAATPARPPQKQDGLFDTGLRDPAAFWENLARLGALVGDDRVGTPAPRDTHRPDAFTLGKPAEAVPAAAPPPVHPPRGPVLRRFRPPWPARVVCAGERPAEIESEPARGPVRAAAGPWRLAGDWWRPEAWAVETWHVELAGGGLYQLARTADGWCVEGALE